MKRIRDKTGRSLLITIVVLSVILLIMPVMVVGEITAARDISKQTVAPGNTFTVTEAVPQINYRILLYIKTMTVNQRKSELHDTL